MKELIKNVEKTLGSLKFAVFIILIFALYLAVGTFVESLNGTDYANRLIYKSAPFMTVQFFMFLSILVATLKRFPLKKPLYGFYVIHSGLMILFIGSFITYISGIDGSMVLNPNTSSREIEINEDVLNIRKEEEGKEITYALPKSAWEKNLNDQYENIQILEFLPFAILKLDEVVDKNTTSSSATYTIENANFKEEFTLSTDERSDFTQNSQLGPLNVHFMPKALFTCFSSPGKSLYIIWNIDKNICTTPEQINAPVKKTKQGQVFLSFKEGNEIISFLPELSPLPADENLKVKENSPFRIFSLNLFLTKPHLFLFGDSLVFYDKINQKWVGKVLHNEKVDLPWMGFKVGLKKLYQGSYPKYVPHAVRPIQEDGKMTEGQTKAVKIKVYDQEYWVTNEKPLGLMINQKKNVFYLGKKQITLPYQLTLTKFKMDTDPGTKNPASYESFVNLFEKNKTTNHHIFMNHPLKHDDFTFYQASYFQTEQGEFGSVLSVNYDPGRPVKYLGSLLLVLGSIWHYIIRRKTDAKFFSRAKI